VLPLVTINLSTVAVIPTMRRQIWRLSNNNIAFQHMKIFKGYVLCLFDKEFISTGLWTALFVVLCSCWLENKCYPSAVTLRVFLLIKSFKKTQYQLVDVFVLPIL
jgi:hypothetical protein